MDLKEGRNYRKQMRKIPADVVMSSDEQWKLTQVIRYEEWNFRVTEVLTREQFQKAMEENRRHSDAVTGAARLVHGYKVDLDTAEAMSESPEDHAHFYRLEIMR